MKRALALWILGLIVSAQVFAQTRNLSGKVTDAATGEALIGVNVTGKGTTTGTVTDIDGNYTLEMPKEVTTLTFSYVGYTTIEKPITSLTINASMAADQQIIDEVIVTALGIKKEEKSVTYNAQKIGGSDMDKARENNLVNSLAGRVAGAQITNSSGSVGSSTRIILRGASSLTGNNQPLFVVNGVPIDNSSYSNASSGGGSGSFDMPNGIASINQDDIENVTILPSAKASALYGVRAANGVILITTKKGKAGENKVIGVDLNTSLTFETPFRLPDYQNSYGQGTNSTSFNFGTGNVGSDGGTDESWGPALDKGLEFVQWNSYTVGGKPLPWVSRPDNVKNIFQKGTTWNNSIALYGANEKGDFRLSFGNLNQKGMIFNTDFNRYTVGLSASYKLTENLIPSFSLNYSKEKSNNLPYSGYASDNIMSQLVWTGRNVDFSALKDWRNLPLTPESLPVAGTPLNWNMSFNNNPFWILENNLNKYNRDRIIGNIQLLYNITDNFSLRVLSGIDFYSIYTTEQKGIGSYDWLDGFYEEFHTRFYELNNELLLSYNKKFVNNKLGISLNASGNMMQQRSKSILGRLTALELPNLYNLGNAKSGSTPIVNSTISESNLNTIRGFGELSWDSWLYADFSVTNDWSSRLPIKNNSFLSYSAGMSFVPSELLKSQKVLSYLKIRGGYASVGNFGALVPYRIVQTYDIREEVPFGSILISDPATLNNPKLKPERTNEWEVGLDLKLFQNRIGLSASYYDKKSKDLLLAVQTSAGSGYTTAWQNAAGLRNRGVELQFNAGLLDKKDYKINFFLNWAKNKKSSYLSW
jgi:TonB-linked SusC/RagA family outer membrane protein